MLNGLGIKVKYKDIQKISSLAKVKEVAISELYNMPQEESSYDVALKESWAIMYIPRFILIDKDFNIVNAYAPRPSSEEIGTLIDSVLNK